MQERNEEMEKWNNSEKIENREGDPKGKNRRINQKGGRARSEVKNGIQDRERRADRRKYVKLGRKTRGTWEIKKGKE